MSFEMNFTIGIAPNMTNLENEMRYIKSTLLYADTITLISPIAHTYFQLTDEADRKNEKTYINLLLKTLPFCESDPYFNKEARPFIEKFSIIVNDKKYKSAPFIYRAKTKKAMSKFGEGITQSLKNMFGQDDCANLTKLIKRGQLKIYDFKNTLDDADNFSIEFFNTLKQAITDQATFPLLDEQSNNLIALAIKDNIMTLTDNNVLNAKHSAMTNKLLLSLPSFEFATIDEILDIRKELEEPLIRFRGKMLGYNTEIQSMPWDEDFKHESNMLYQKHIAPTILELNELSKENNLLKNLGYNFLYDDSFINGAGGLLLNIAAAGTISSFIDAISLDKAVLITGGTYAASKIMKTYKEYEERDTKIKKNDMYFYYKAGKFLKNMHK